MDLLISEATIDLASVTGAFEQKAKGAGGIVTFAGQVREFSSDTEVLSLYLQIYPEMTEKGIASAIADAYARWPLTTCYVQHRIGDMAPGETIVFVGTASKHRRAAFDAADFLMDYLKTRAVFWKKETTSKSTQWIEPRAEDYADQSRWTKARE